MTGFSAVYGHSEDVRNREIIDLQTACICGLEDSCRRLLMLAPESPWPTSLQPGPPAGERF